MTSSSSSSSSSKPTLLVKPIRSKPMSPTPTVTPTSGRFWSEHHETLILTHLSHYKSHHAGADPVSAPHLPSFSDAIRKLVPLQFSNRQLADKIRKLRVKLLAKTKPGSDHEAELMRLAKEVWGERESGEERKRGDEKNKNKKKKRKSAGFEGKGEVEERKTGVLEEDEVADKRENGGGKGEGKKRRSGISGKSRTARVRVRVENGGGNDKANRRKIGVSKGGEKKKVEYPTLEGIVEKLEGDLKNSMMCGSSFRRALAALPENVAAELEEKCLKQQCAEEAEVLEKHFLLMAEVVRVLTSSIAGK